jgi:hypothetical protein
MKRSALSGYFVADGALCAKALLKHAVATMQNAINLQAIENMDDFPGDRVCPA